MGKMYQIDSKRIKTLFISEAHLVLSEKQVYDIDKFINMYKYSDMYGDRTLKFTYPEIKSIVFENDKMNFKGRNKSDEFDIKINDMGFDSPDELIEFKGLLDNGDLFQKKVVQENKFKSAVKSRGFAAFVFGAILTSLASENNLDFESTSGRRKAAGKILGLIFQTLGPTLSMIIGIIVTCIGSYYIWKNFQNPNDLTIYEIKD